MHDLKIAAAYIRVSTDDQVEYSPDSQLKNIRNYAKSHGYIVPDEYIFIDEGISGKNTKKRPAFNRMIGTAKLKPKPFDAILLWKFSRFARNREDSIVYKSMLRKQLGIDVVSISESIGDDKMSIIFEAMIEAMDEYYSINLAEEVKRGMLERVTRGEAVSVAPFGYKIVDKKLVVDPDTAPIIKMIFAEFIAGGNKTQLARKLNDMGIKTIRGNNWDNRGIEYVLNNPVYIGKIRWTPTGKTRRNYSNPDTMIVDGSHEPIISVEDFEKTKLRIDEIKRSYKKYERHTPCDYMLRGVVRCSNCGATLVMASSKTFLQCHNYNRGQCQQSHGIALSKLNKMVITSIETSFETYDFPLNIKNNPFEDTGINYSELIAKEENKLKRAREAYEAGVYDLSEYSESKKLIQERIDTLKKQMPKTNKLNIEALKKQFAEKHKHTLEKLKSSDISEYDKNELLRTFVENIIFYRDKGNISVFFYM
jgi:DNA invertase Pin-like site-specific DNA recombinase